MIWDEFLRQHTRKRIHQAKKTFWRNSKQLLNLIERLWKFLRKKVFNTGFYRTKEKFRQAVKDFFDNIGNYKEELESLLTLKFRLCNSQTISF